MVFVGCQNKDEEAKTLHKIAAVVNKQCPVKIDYITRLDSCSIQGKTLCYSYTILKDSVFDVKLFEEIGIPAIVSEMKMNPQAEIFRKNGFIIKHNYFDLRGKAIFDYTLTPSDY